MPIAPEVTLRLMEAGAFLYGSAVRGDARPDSDIDMFLIVGEEQPTRTLRRQISEAELLIGRPPDIVEDTAATCRPRECLGALLLSHSTGERSRHPEGALATEGSRSGAASERDPSLRSG
jgi:predicted nucleotidyltransferase